MGDPAGRKWWVSTLVVLNSVGCSQSTKIGSFLGPLDGL